MKIFQHQHYLDPNSSPTKESLTMLLWETWAMKVMKEKMMIKVLLLLQHLYRSFHVLEVSHGWSAAAFVRHFLHGKHFPGEAKLPVNGHM